MIDQSVSHHFLVVVVNKIATNNKNANKKSGSFGQWAEGGKKAIKMQSFVCRVSVSFELQFAKSSQKVSASVVNGFPFRYLLLFLVDYYSRYFLWLRAGTDGERCNLHCLAIIAL